MRWQYLQSNSIEHIVQVLIVDFARLIGHLQQRGTLVEHNERMTPIGRSFHDPIIVQRFHNYFTRIRCVGILNIQIGQ